MKTTQIATALILTLTAAAAFAGHRAPPAAPLAFTDTARVISSTPVYEEYNEPRRDCWTERNYRYEKDDRSYGGAILGAVVGGVVGNQFGKGNGKTAATAAGAAIGAMTGDNIDNRDRDVRRVPVDEERCRTVDNWQRRVVGYDVVYLYQGNRYTTYLPYDPGYSLRVKVQVSVDER